jgi:hypothetical protein
MRACPRCQRHRKLLTDALLRRRRSLSFMTASARPIPPREPDGGALESLTSGLSADLEDWRWRSSRDGRGQSRGRGAVHDSCVRHGHSRRPPNRCRSLHGQTRSRACTRRWCAASASAAPSSAEAPRSPLFSLLGGFGIKPFVYQK